MEIEFAATEIDTPVGPLGVVVTERGLYGVTFEGLTATPSGPRVDLPEALQRVRREFAEYFAGARQEFTLPLDWRASTGYARQVLTTLHETVPYGRVTSYGALAAAVGGRQVEGEHGAARAVGRVMAGNPIPLVVPCHRVLASDGSLHGFGGGLETKRRLLAREGSAPMTLDDVLALE